jgi:hypothetical protein
VAKCSSCESEILWVYSEQGRAMPMDPEPNKVGPNGEAPTLRKERVDIVQGGLRRKIVHVMTKDELAENTKPLYLSHFVSCPHANMHRK